MGETRRALAEIKVVDETVQLREYKIIRAISSLPWQPGSEYLRVLGTEDDTCADNVLPVAPSHPWIQSLCALGAPEVPSTTAERGLFPPRVVAVATISRLEWSLILSFESSTYCGS